MSSGQELSGLSAGLSPAIRLSDDEFRRLSGFIEQELGIKMPDTKRVMLESRLQKRLRSCGCRDYTSYLDMVFDEEGDSRELVHLIDAVTTNKTDFFREPDHFRVLSEQVLPVLESEGGWGRDRPFYLWSAGCSSGEEPYTLAMVLSEYHERTPDFRFRILATDISTRMLDRARTGIYAEDRVEPVPAEYRKKYLLRGRSRGERQVRLRPELRRKVLFERLNLMHRDYGIASRFQVIFCRNVIIYFDRNRQEYLLTQLSRLLVPGGFLFLGHSETLTGMNLPLRSVAPTVYRKPGALE